MEIVGLDHVQLAMPAGGEAAAIAFYEGLLGIPQVPKPPNLAARGGCWFERGALKVHLGVDAAFRPATKAHPAFLVDDVRALAAELTDAGCRVVDDEPLEGHDRVYVDDPFGNRIELLEPVERRSRPNAMDAAELADRTQIRRLVDDYALAADTGDGGRFAGAFTPDGVLVASETSRYEGADELATVPDKLARYDRTRHVVANHVVDLAPSGDEATGVTYCDAHHLLRDDRGDERDRILHLRYLDRFVRTTAGWRIAERRLELDWITEHPTDA